MSTISIRNEFLKVKNIVFFACLVVCFFVFYKRCDCDVFASQNHQKFKHSLVLSSEIAEILSWEWSFRASNFLYSSLLNR